MTPADQQQVAVPEPAGEPIDAQVIDMTREAAERAALWVQARKYGPNMAQLIAYIASKAVDTSDLNAVIMEQMAIRILNAESPDEILDPFNTLKGADLMDRPMWVEKVMYLESDKTEGFPWYVSLDVRDPNTGQIKPVIVGGEKLVPQVAGLDMHEAFPMNIKISSRTTRAGNTVYELVPVV